MLAYMGGIDMGEARAPVYINHATRVLLASLQKVFLKFDGKGEILGTSKVSNSNMQSQAYHACWCTARYSAIANHREPTSHSRRKKGQMPCLRKVSIARYGSM